MVQPGLYILNKSLGRDMTEKLFKDTLNPNITNLYYRKLPRLISVSISVYIVLFFIWHSATTLGTVTVKGCNAITARSGSNVVYKQCHL